MDRGEYLRNTLQAIFVLVMLNMIGTNILTVYQVELFTMWSRFTYNISAEAFGKLIFYLILIGAFGAPFCAHVLSRRFLLLLGYGLMGTMWFVLLLFLLVDL